MKQFLFLISCVPKKNFFILTAVATSIHGHKCAFFYRQVNNWPDFNTFLMNKSTI